MCILCHYVMLCIVYSVVYAQFTVMIQRLYISYFTFKSSEQYKQ
jgi:hypothetical protein